VVKGGAAKGCQWPILLKKSVSPRLARAKPKKRTIDVSLREIWGSALPELAQIST
jgi:hypothetical protein